MPSLAALSRRNVSNKRSSQLGVQIEISTTLRNSFLKEA